jgi:hypothetical protein
MEKQQYDGQDEDLHEAVKKAWDNKTKGKQKDETATYKVEIYAFGNNPLSGYGINLLPPGG